MAEEEEPIAPPEAEEIDRLARYLRAKQNLVAAILGSLGMMLVAVFLWFLVAITAGRELVLIGVFVGVYAANGARRFGRGIDVPFGVVGALFGVIGVLVGKALIVAYLTATADGLRSVFDVLGSETFSIYYRESFAPIVFAVIIAAGAVGFRFSFFRIKESEVAPFLEAVDRDA